MEISSTEIAESSLKMHTFTAELLNAQVNFEVLKLKDSLYIYVGGEERNFSDLGIAMPLSANEVTTTRILGSVHLQTASDLMTRRLSTKLKKPIYLSYNLPMDDVLLMKAAEKRIQEEITANSELF